MTEDVHKFIVSTTPKTILRILSENKGLMTMNHELTKEEKAILALQDIYMVVNGQVDSDILWEGRTVTARERVLLQALEDLHNVVDRHAIAILK